MPPVLDTQHRDQLRPHAPPAEVTRAGPPAHPDLPEGWLGLVLAALNHMDQGIMVFDRNLNLVAWNRIFFELLDFPETLAKVGTPFAAFMEYNAERGEYGPGDRAEQVRVRVEAARRLEPHRLERVRPSGRILEIKGEPLPGRAGFVSVFSDVTEQRRHERQIVEENAGLQSRLRLITDSLPALIAYIDPDERYQFANRRYAEWFGFTRVGLLGRPVAEVMGPDLYGRLGPYVRRALAGETVSYEYVLDRPGQPRRHARSILVPEISDTGKVLGLFVLSLETTGQKEAEAALLQAQKLQAVGQLTGGLAHDFNNLLTIIIGNLLALRDLVEPDAARDHLDPAMAAAQRGAELTRRLLAFARRQPLDMAVTEVDALVAGMVGLLRRTLARNIEVALSIRGGPLHARLDPAQMENAILNLALNARDAMPGGGRVALELRAEEVAPGASPPGFDDAVPPGPYVRVEVSDCGAGMDAETLSRACDPFFTRKQPGMGSGLGLSMVYGFVKQSGGFLGLISQPGQGTQVTILLPAVPPPELAPATAPAPVPPDPGTEIEGAHGDLVLVVDDEPDVRALIRRHLTASGRAVLAASSGAEALALLETVPSLRALITDVVMPGEPDGLRLARQAQAMRPDLKVVVISGYADGLAERLPFPVIRKPFTPDQILEALAR